MVLVLASIFNKAAVAFVKEFSGAAASLVTCSSLVLSESHICFPDFENSFITINEQRIFLSAIKGIINLLPCVIPEEMYFYDESEYTYQSQEFAALITFLLAVLKVPVINKPDLQNGGKVQNSLSWTHIASTLNIPQVVKRVESQIIENYSQYYHCLREIIYLPCKGGANTKTILDHYTCKIAQYINVVYLKCYFTQDFLFLHATTVPDVRDFKVSKLLLQYFN